jgi:hypothetical protein
VVSCTSTGELHERISAPHGQIEVSRTLVLDQPRRARAFFETLVQDNLGIGRPDEISLIFDRRIRSDTDTGFATRVVTRGVDVTINVFYKHSRIKQYLKEGRALRVETVVNSPDDLNASWEFMPHG